MSSWAKTTGFAAPVHLGDERDRRERVPPARVRQLWQARPQHRGPRLVCDEVGPPPAVPLHSLRGNTQHEQRDRVPRSSLQSTGVRPGREPTRRGRQHFCDRPSDGPFPHPIARWLERAATAAARFNHRMLRDFDIIELQADDLCTFIGSKRRTLWLFATIEVSSRLWAGSVLGRRSYRNTKAAINDVILRGRLVGCPLIATDGFEYYVGAMGRLLGSACVYGQVLKTRQDNRVVRVERRVKIGTASRLNAALLASEDSETLNTSFIERLNLTIRQGSAYLRRRHATPVAQTSFAGTSSSCGATTISSGRTGR